MNICIINNLYPPYERGGAEQVVVKTVDGLLSAGHSVVVITTAPRGSYKEVQGNLTIYRYRPINLFFYPEAHKYPVFIRFLWHVIDTFHVSSMRFVEKILQEEKPDVVHTHNLMGMSFLIPRMIRRNGVRHIHTLHDVQLVEPSGIIRKSRERYWRYTGFPIRFYAASMRLLLGSPDVVISPSQFLLNFYESRGFFLRSKRVVLRNPVTSSDTVFPHLPHDKPSFLYVGQIEDHKGVPLLVQTFLEFVNSGGAGTLHIVGHGSQFDRIVSLADGNAQIIIHGGVRREELSTYFREADVTIVPSLCYENSPTVIFESFSFGVPVLASNVEGIAELIIEGENGLTFATENRQSLLDKICWCSHNHTILHEMRTKTTRSLAGLSVEDYIKTLVLLYQG